MFALSAGVTQLGDGGRRILQQPFLVCLIRPCARNNARSVAGTDPMFKRIDQRIEGRGIHKSLFNQQGLQSLYPQRKV